MTLRTLLPVLLVGCSRLRGSGSETEPDFARRKSEPNETLRNAAPRASSSPSDPKTGSLPAPKAGAIPAFPGAQGFGAVAKGGRAGAVCHVKTLAKEGPGSLKACVERPGPRTIVFDVSGVIEGPVEVPHGELTLAGQTSPLGVTITGGLLCDNVYDQHACRDVVIRHLRLRRGAPDTLRLGGTENVIVDHCSLGGAEDETVEITRSSRITLQYSVFAEPRGDHYKWGGVLLNYSKDVMPLDQIAIHHSVWNGVAGRLPEITCEENGDGPGTSNCSGRTLSLELSNNVLWDVSDPVWYNRCTKNNEGNDCASTAPSVFVRMNWVGNVMVRRSDADPEAPFFEPHLFSTGRNAVFHADNHLFLGAKERPLALPKGESVRHAFPLVDIAPAKDLVVSLANVVGAFPRDPMDQRLASYLRRPVDERPRAWIRDTGVVSPDLVAPPKGDSKPPSDTDQDGIPDAWEQGHGLRPAQDDSADLTLGARENNGVRGCTPGYTALECYLNELAERRLLERP